MQKPIYFSNPAMLVTVPANAAVLGKELVISDTGNKISRESVATLAMLCQIKQPSLALLEFAQGHVQLGNQPHEPKMISAVRDSELECQGHPVQCIIK